MASSEELDAVGRWVVVTRRKFDGVEELCGRAEARTAKAAMRAEVSMVV